MIRRRARTLLVCLMALSVPFATGWSRSGYAQTPDPAPAAAPPGPDEAAPEPYSDEELQVLVARIALYPDDLVAAIAEASLYPLQIVEAARFLEARKKDPKLAPKAGWDGSVIALLNYPEIVQMMSDDLDWTQSLGEALVNQQKDVLIAIQQLRDEAVAANVIRSDDKVTVSREGDNIVIAPATPDKVYIPSYQPAMLYDPSYPLVPVTYAANPYPSYFWPTATFFTAAITGAVWASAVDWNNWNVWGGRWRGDLGVNCINCYRDRNFSGRLNVNDIDWKNVDRSRLQIDRNQFGAIDGNRIRQGLDTDRRNDLRARAGDLRRSQPGAPGAAKAGDIRRSALQNHNAAGQIRAGQIQTGNAGNALARHPNVADRPAGVNRPPGSLKPGGAVTDHNNGPAKINRPASMPKPGGRIDQRPKVPSGLGEVRKGRTAQLHSARGAAARGGGQRALPHRPAGGGKPHVRAGARRP